MTDPSTGERAGGDTASIARPVVLLVAHGSRNPAAGAEHERLCVAVQSLLDADDDAGPGPEVRPAYLEITDPDIPTAIDAAAADGATTIRLLPHFLSPGNHVAVDLPRIAEASRARHPGVRIDLMEHLGADPALVALLARRAKG